MSEEGSLKGRIEAILFVAGEAVRLEELARALNLPVNQVEKALEEIKNEYDYEQRGFCLKRFGRQVQ